MITLQKVLMICGPKDHTHTIVITSKTGLEVKCVGTKEMEGKCAK